MEVGERISSNGDRYGRKHGGRSSGGEDEFTDDTDDDTSPYTDVNNGEVLNWQLALTVGNMLVGILALDDPFSHSCRPSENMRNFAENTHTSAQSIRAARPYIDSWV